MNLTIKILYFASLGERLHTQNEDFSCPEGIKLSSLKQQLAARGEAWEKEMTSLNLLTAVNQALITEDIELRPGDELAFFPPVTGG